MSIALWSAALTLGFWLLAVVAGFVLAGLSFGWLLRHLVPTRQERLPRVFVLAAAVATGISLGGIAGLHVGQSRALLAFGDALVAERVVVLTPFTGSPYTPAGSDRPLSEDVAQVAAEIERETTRFLRGGALAYIAGHLILGGLHEPAAIGFELARQYTELQSSAAMSGERFAGAWVLARPRLDQMALRSLATSLILGLSYLLLLAIGTCLFLLLVWRDLRVGTAATKNDAQQWAPHPHADWPFRQRAPGPARDTTDPA